MKHGDIYGNNDDAKTHLKECETKLRQACDLLSEEIMRELTRTTEEYGGYDQKD